MSHPSHLRFPIVQILILCLVFEARFANAQAHELDAVKSEIAMQIGAAIAEGDLPGAVVGFWHDGQWLLRESYGNRQVEPSIEEMSTDTVFDMASITKPVATATSVLMLVERGAIALEAPVQQYLPKFTGDGRDEVLVKHLLTHTAGLIPDNSIGDYKSGHEVAWDRLYASTIKSPPGSKFVYSDVSFLLLGKIVEAVSGESVDKFAKSHIYEPLKMNDSGYNPNDALRPRIAPTEPRDGIMLKGEVHDPRAALLGGVAGHAGLFSTLDDLGRYAQMMLNRGELEGVRIMQPETVFKLTAPHLLETRKDFGDVSRTYGFDHHSPYSYNSGDLLSGAAFGHGGFTGTVLWIDPARNCFFVFLSNRLHPDGKGNVNRLAGSIAKKIVERCLPTLPPRNDFARIDLGIDVLAESGFRMLKGMRVGLVSNHTGRDASGQNTAELLHHAGNVNLVAIFSPEHGYEGLLDQSRIGDSKADGLEVPIFSLYGTSRRPSKEQLESVDCLVYDIQDIGCRFYTYISTMKECMLACAEHNKKFIVLDRPNPLGGLHVRGPLIDPGKESFVACHNIPVQHGMTVGELALLMRKELDLKLELEIVPVRNWSREMTFDVAGLEWVNPSPNMRSLLEANLYPGIGLLETSNISVGRGTDRPFEWIGAPWISGQQMASWFNAQNIAGVHAVARSNKPTASKYADEICGGVDLFVTDVQELDAIDLGLTIARGLQALYPDHWKGASINTLLVNASIRDAIIAGSSLEDLKKLYQPSLDEFLTRRRSILLYQ